MWLMDHLFLPAITNATSPFVPDWMIVKPAAPQYAVSFETGSIA